MKLWIALVVSICCALTMAHASEVTVFESCTDAAGKTVAAELDVTLPVLVRSLEDHGAATIRYNPSLLPRLKAATRLFFFARECDSHVNRTGLPADGEPSIALARQADCRAVAALLGAGLLQRAELALLQSDLHFSTEEWQLLPGPRRDFDFSACPRSDVLKMPLPSLPTAQQSSWNSCARHCGDRLWACQKPCHGEACTSHCLDVYEECAAACGTRPAE
jgi:hypothetical protein